MSKSYQEFRSREALRALSHDELVNIIVNQPTDSPPSWVFSARQTDPSDQKDAGVRSGEIDDSTLRDGEIYQQIAENFPNGAVAILDRQLTYVRVMGQELHRLGITEKAFVGKPIGVVTTASEAQRIKQELQRVFEGIPCKLETSLGEDTYLVSAIPFTFREGKIDQILAVSQNVTERQRALRQAQESEAQFRALAENIPGVVYISTNDTERQMVYLSEKIKDLCGYTSEEFCSGKVSSRILMHPEDRPLVKQALKEAIQHGKSYHFTYRWRHKEGHDCWIEEYGVNIIKDQKQYFQGVLFDVSEKKHYEKELQQQNEDLKKANAELDHFAYSVSHDLRAPLTSAMGLLELLKQEKDPAQRDQFTEIIQKSLLRLDGFIQEVIHLTKNARTELALEKVNISALIADLIASQKHHRDYDSVDVQVEVDQALSFQTDPARLWIILNNLVANALRYHFPFRTVPYVRITATADDQELVLTVEDNGIGIEAEHLDKIFNMFYRATSRRSGSGLGLYLVKETVERLRGTIEVQSIFEQGTTFTVCLPTVDGVS